MTIEVSTDTLSAFVANRLGLGRLQARVLSVHLAQCRRCSRRVLTLAVMVYRPLPGRSVTGGFAPAWSQTQRPCAAPSLSGR